MLPMIGHKNTVRCNRIIYVVVGNDADAVAYELMFDVSCPHKKEQNAKSVETIVRLFHLDGVQ